MTIKLEFEKSNSGQQEGINDAGIETFAGRLAHGGSMKSNVNSSLRTTLSGSTNRSVSLMVTDIDIPRTFTNDLAPAEILGEYKNLWRRA